MSKKITYAVSITNYEIFDDYELVKACCNGEKDAFSQIVLRYKNLVYSVVLRMTTDNEEANDLAQEVFIKIYKNLEKYSPEFKFSTWTMKITTNHIIDYRRKKKQETVGIEAAEHLPSGDSPEQQFLAKEQSLMLKNILENLPDIYKVPIILYHQQGLSYQEISEITQEPLSKVKNRIFRGRKMLKESIMINGGAKYGL